MRRRAVQVATALAGTLIIASLASGLLGAGSVIPGSEEPTRASDGAAGGPAEPAAPVDDHAHGPDADPGHHDANGSNGSNASTMAYEKPKVEPAQPRHEHPLAPGEGSVPTRAEASEFDKQFEDFTVEGNQGLAEMAQRGHITGSGTVEDPYVIERFRVTDDLTIKDTSKALVIKDSYIEGQLTLNFVGEDVYVHHTYIWDLRVNENVQRDGPTTAGLFEHNEIDFIGQLRHFGGEFAHNEIGPRPDGVVDRYLSDTGPQDLPDEVVWNFDGYHLGHVHNNTVIGRVDVKLHGHFHGSCQVCIPHDHAEPADFPPGNEPDEALSPDSRHSYRFHTLDFENNTIRAKQPDVALRFYDEAHAGDDQTANSEPNAYLEDRHEHHQFVRVANNRIETAALVFDILIAQDERHDGMGKEALVHLVGNEVHRDTPRGESLLAAYVIHAADHATIEARDNAFTFEKEDSAVPQGYRWAVEDEPSETTGFLVHESRDSEASIVRTTGQGASYGVTIAQTQSTPVRLVDNDFNASKEDKHRA